MQIYTGALSDYIRGVLQGIDQGISDGFVLSSPVKFQIGLRNFVEKDEFIRIEIAGIGGKRSNEEHARIEFEVVSPLSPAVKEAWEQIGKSLLDNIKKQFPLKSELRAES